MAFVSLPNDESDEMVDYGPSEGVISLNAAEGFSNSAVRGLQNKLSRAKLSTNYQGFMRLADKTQSSLEEIYAEPHTLLMFSDEGYRSLPTQLQASVDKNEESQLAERVVMQHVLPAYIPTEALMEGEPLSVNTADESVTAVIYPPRISEARLPQGMKTERPLVALQNSRGQTLNYSEVSGIVSKNTDGTVAQQIILLTRPLSRFQ